jgi:hypothetical protein
MTAKIIKVVLANLGISGLRCFLRQHDKDGGDKDGGDKVWVTKGAD